MLISLKIKNFRNIDFFSVSNFDLKNHIYGENGIGKTNFLYAIYILFQNKIDLDLKDLVKNGENDFFLESIFLYNGIENKISYHYDIVTNKKTIFLNGKKVTKKILNQNILHTSFFGPLSMNMFYLGPKYRRDFLDNTIMNSFFGYKDDYVKYEEILKNRNKILKNISIGISKKEEIVFFDELFINFCEKIYIERIKYINYLKLNINNITKFINKKYTDINFVYNTKVDLKDIRNSIQKYNKINFERDIILGKTNIGPHLDDFDIVVDNKSIFNFLSRGETKIVILYLIFLETEYIKIQANRDSIILIDDILSELDIDHLEKIINIFINKQFFSSGITSISNVNNIYLT